MANYKPVKTSFKPGNKFGKGRPAIPSDLKLVQSIPKEIVGKIIDSFWAMKISELEYILDLGELNAMETAIAKQIKMATDGNLYSLVFLFDRRYGKPKETSESDVSPDSVGSLIAKWKTISPEDHIKLLKESKGKGNDE